MKGEILLFKFHLSETFKIDRVLDWKTEIVTIQ